MFISEICRLIRTVTGVKLARFAGVISCAIIFALVAGCAGPLSVKYDPKPPAEKMRLKQPVKIVVRQFIDTRSVEGKERRKIGDILTGVIISDMIEKEIILTEDIADIVTNAFIKELSLAGFNAVPWADGADKDANFVFTGEVSQFKLNVGARDEIFIEITPKLQDVKTGKTAWSEKEAAKEDRYAGSFGNSRSSLSKYITATISKTIRKAIDEAKPVLTGVSAGEGAGAVIQAKGKLSITSEPSRAKVYLNDVYYGVTPFTSEIDAGIYELNLKFNGFKNIKEKLSVRKGEITEMDVKFEKE